MSSPLGMLDIAVTFLKREVMQNTCDKCKKNITNVFKDLEETLEQKQRDWFKKAFYES